jgi:hypothetical protein
MKSLISIICFIFCLHLSSRSQSGEETGLSGSKIHSFLDKITQKFQMLNDQTNKYTEKILEQMDKQEKAIEKKLRRSDSAKYKSLYGVNGLNYPDLQKKLAMAPHDTLTKNSIYNPYLDTIKTSLSYLQNKFPDKYLNSTELSNAKQAISQYEARYQAALDIENTIQIRKQQLKESLKNECNRLMEPINKELYYYREQMNYYRDLADDPKKLEQKTLEILANTKEFKSFMEKNSYLSMLFPQPQNFGTQAALEGLQTKSVVQQAVSKAAGMGQGTNLMGSVNSGSGPIPMSGDYMESQVQNAKSALDALKDKVAKMGGSSSDFNIPDFKPNTQKVKTFLERLEYGFNIQMQKATTTTPAISEIAATLGYKMNDNLSVGTGISYNMGLGQPFNHIAITSQGIGFRSYVDLKIKYSIWLSGGFEEDYNKVFQSLNQLKSMSDWQQSGLIGLMKKTKVGKSKETRIQILWDFLSYRQIPQTSPIQFRFGYGF